MKSMIIKRNDTLYQQIVSYFEGEIMEGRLKPGARLPATTELSKMFNVNPDTVQQSLKQLADRGFVSRTPGRGTFIRKGISSRTLALIFKHSLFIDEEISFYSSYLNDLVVLGEKEHWNLRFFLVSENLNPEDASGEKGFVDLKKAINDGEVRAVVEFCSNPSVQDYLRNECPVPVSFSDVTVDMPGFLRRGLDYLRDRGYRKVAVLTAGYPELQAVLKSYRQQHGEMELSLYRSDKADHREGYQLIRQVYAKEAPEALLITNDRVFTGAWYYLLEKGIRVPQDLAVLTHTNKGREPMSHVPLTRLEIDPMDFAREIYHEITAKIEGRNYELRPVVASLVPGKSCGEK